MNQKTRNALDDLETTADKVEDRFMSDMIMQSVNELREELEE